MLSFMITIHLMQDLLEKDESLELGEANPKAEGDQYSSKVFAAISCMADSMQHLLCVPEHINYSI